MEGDDGFAADVGPGGEGAGGEHGDVGGPGRARDAHFATKNQDGVENQIRAKADDHAHHGPDRGTFRTHHGGEAEGEVCEEVWEDDDLKVGFGGLAGTGRHFVRAAPTEDGIEVEEDERRQCDKEEELEGDKLADEFFAGGQIFCAELDGKDGGMACADEDAKGREHHHERVGQGETSHGVGAAPLADVEAVDNAIEGVEGHGDEGGP